MLNRYRAKNLAYMTGGAGALVTAFSAAGAAMAQGSLLRATFFVASAIGAAAMGAAAFSLHTNRMRACVRRSIAPGKH